MRHFYFMMCGLIFISVLYFFGLLVGGAGHGTVIFMEISFGFGMVMPIYWIVVWAFASIRSRLFSCVVLAMLALQVPIWWAIFSLRPEEVDAFSASYKSIPLVVLFSLLWYGCGVIFLIKSAVFGLVSLKTGGGES